jgi:hypothetical protein
MCRIFEFPVVKAPSTADASKVQIMLSKLNDNFGHAGLLYAQFLGANHDAIEKEMETLLSVLEKATKSQQDERFWVCLIGTILLGAKYANQLGLTEIDQPGLRAFMLTQLDRLRKLRVKQGVDLNKTDNLTTLLQRFFATQRMKHMLISNRVNVARGKPKRGTYVALPPTTDPTKIDGLHVQVGVEDKLIRISSTALSEWCRNIGYPRDNLVTRLETEFGLRDVTGILGSGVAGFQQLPERLLEIDCNGKQELEEFIDGLRTK